MAEQDLSTEARRQRAEYIERMALEMRRLAAGPEFQLLAYLLDMAAEEAGAIRGTVRPSRVAAAPDDGRIPRVRNHAGADR